MNKDTFKELDKEIRNTAEALSSLKAARKALETICKHEWNTYNEGGHNNDIVSECYICGVRK